MNQKTIVDNRPVVWTGSANGDLLYCLYVHCKLVYEDLTLEDFYPLYKKAVAQYSS